MNFQAPTILCALALFAAPAMAQGYRSEGSCDNVDGTRYSSVVRWSRDTIAATRQRRGQAEDFVFVACGAPSQIRVPDPKRPNSARSPVDVIDAALVPGGRVTVGQVRDDLTAAGYGAELTGFAVQSCLCLPDATRKIAVPQANTSASLDDATVGRLREYLLGSGNF